MNSNCNLESSDSDDGILNEKTDLNVDITKDNELFQIQSQLEEAQKIIIDSEKLLKKSFFDFNSLFENSSQAFLLIDGNLFVRNFNKTADTNSHLILKRSLNNK
jgi:hypothetical protein